MNVFVGRSEELALLNDCFTSDRAELAIVYGRRRVGKTELLVEACRGRAHVFSASREAPMSEQLRAFSREMFAAGAPAGRYLDSYQSWEDAFRDIPNLPVEGKKIVVIDEFPYLVKADPSLPSVLQNIWDAVLCRADVALILCGSAMSFIEKELLAEKNPLYGRATVLLKVLPLPYTDAGAFFPAYSAAERIGAYAIVGGVPHYLLQFDPSLPLGENVKRSILRRGAALYSETEFLMRQEFRETAVYNALIQAIALGATQLNEIAQKTMVPAQKASVYLKNLIEVGLVEREYPVGAGLQERAKGQRGLYRISDPFFRFWYAFVFGNLTALEAGDAEGVWRYEVEPELNAFIAMPFEQICRDWMIAQNRAGELPFRCREVGRWWNDCDEIDVLALSSRGRRALAGECKFRGAPVDGRVLATLRKKARDVGAAVTDCYLFSKSGFSEGLTGEARADATIHLIDANRLYS